MPPNPDSIPSRIRPCWISVHSSGWSAAMSWIIVSRSVSRQTPPSSIVTLRPCFSKAYAADTAAGPDPTTQQSITSQSPLPNAKDTRRTIAGQDRPASLQIVLAPSSHRRLGATTSRNAGGSRSALHLRVGNPEHLLKGYLLLSSRMEIKKLVKAI